MDIDSILALTKVIPSAVKVNLAEKIIFFIIYFSFQRNLFIFIVFINIILLIVYIIDYNRLTFDTREH